MTRHLLSFFAIGPSYRSSQIRGQKKVFFFTCSLGGNSEGAPVRNVYSLPTCLLLQSATAIIYDVSWLCCTHLYFLQLQILICSVIKITIQFCRELITRASKVDADGDDACMRQMLDIAKELAVDGSVEGTMKALELVTDLIRETRGGEGAVLQALKEAKENHQRVMASRERPGQNWVLLRKKYLAVPHCPVWKDVITDHSTSAMKFSSSASVQTCML